MRVVRQRPPSPTALRVIEAFHAHPAATSGGLADMLGLDPAHVRKVLQREGLRLRAAPHRITGSTGGPDVRRHGREPYSPVAKVTQTKAEIVTPPSVSGDADTGPRVASSGPVAGCSHTMLAQVVGYMAQCASCRTWIRMPGR